jgi:hypothetical protein
MGYAQGNVDIMSFALWISRGLRMRNGRRSHLARHRSAWPAVGGLPLRTDGGGWVRRERATVTVGSQTILFLFFYKLIYHPTHIWQPTTTP